MKRVSFSRLLRNDRLMMVCSLLLAITVWYFVISGSSNISTRTITCTLNTVGVSNGSLQVIEEKNVTVDVVVEGAWSDILQLTQEDIRVQLNAADIQNAGNCRLNVVAGRNSQKGGYEILSTSPSFITLFCDEWVEGQEFTVEAGEVVAEAPHVSAEGDERDIHAIKVEEAALPGGKMIVQGPLSEVSRIDRVAAMVYRETALSAKQVFEGDVVAMDANGAVLDLQYCKFLRYAESPADNPDAPLMDITALNVEVTVKERREIPFTYEVLNVPSGVDIADILTLEPTSMIVEGEQELLNTYADKLGQLKAVDFDTLSTAEKAVADLVELPAGLTVIGGDKYVTVQEDGTTHLNVGKKFDWSGYSRRTFTWQIGSDISNSPIRFQNVPVGKTVRMLTNELQVTVFGKKAAVDALNVKNFSATVDMNDSSLGTYQVRPVLNTNEAWVYYGSTGYTIYVSIEQPTT
ncbi:MAG: hypothetical protein E7552_05755 [Ruminococcaceae bacterium]|nr:hypothetical protein [Oscillospiraceae bacterium]